jgi:hypothetical protein
VDRVEGGILVSYKGISRYILGLAVTQLTRRTRAGWRTDAGNKAEKTPGAIDDPQDVQTLRHSPVEDEHLFETRHPEDPERLKPWIFDSGSPSHVWLCGD